MILNEESLGPTKISQNPSSKSTRKGIPIKSLTLDVAMGKLKLSDPKIQMNSKDKSTGLQKYVGKNHSYGNPFKSNVYTFTTSTRLNSAPESPNESTQRVLQDSDGLKMILKMPDRRVLRPAAKEQIQSPLEDEVDIGKSISIPDTVMMIPKPHQLEGLRWLIASELNTSQKGGLLCDEMGLGKTFQMILLMACRPGKTLIVVPSSLLQQWKSEILAAINLKIHIYHDGKYNLKGDEDVVITSYNTLRGKNSNLLTATSWVRVILDEAHTIRNYKTQTAQACFQLKADYRWCVTGTPIQNDMKDAFSYFHFLQIRPFCSYGRFKVTTQPFLQRAFDEIMLRRESKSVKLELPSRTENKVFLKLSIEEQRFYEDYVAKYKDRQADFLENSEGLMVLMVRCKLLCNHLGLIGNRADVETNVFEDDLGGLTGLLGDLTIDTRYFCIICESSFERNLFLHHCDRCGSQKLNIRELMNQASTVFSTKIDAILKLLLKNSQSQTKTIVFSQFTKSLKLLEQALKLANLNFIRYDGTLSSANRGKALNDFKSTDANILTASLTATATGLNIVDASHVVFFEQWWNPTVEDQAIARVHRIGQTRNVTVTRFIVRDTIEEAILSIQEKKVSFVKLAEIDKRLR